MEDVHTCMMNSKSADQLSHKNSEPGMYSYTAFPNGSFSTTITLSNLLCLLLLLADGRVSPVYPEYFLPHQLKHLAS